MGCEGLVGGPFLPGDEKWSGAMCGRSWMSKIEALRATNREYSDGFGPVADFQNAAVSFHFTVIATGHGCNDDLPVCV